MSMCIHNGFPYLVAIQIVSEPTIIDNEPTHDDTIDYSKFQFIKPEGLRGNFPLDIFSVNQKSSNHISFVHLRSSLIQVLISKIVFHDTYISYQSGLYNVHQGHALNHSSSLLP